MLHRTLGYCLAVSFIGGENQNTRPATKHLSNLHKVVSRTHNLSADCIHLIGSYVNKNTCYYCQDSYKESQTMCLFIYTNVLYFNNTLY